MNILPISQLNQGFSLEFKGQVWKILIDEVHPLLVMQIRDGETYQTSFAAIDTSENKLLWQDFTLSENWWLGMAGLHQGVLFLYTYPDTQKPEPQGIIAVDIVTQELLWQTQDATFYQVLDNQLIAVSMKQTSRQYLLLAPKTGEILDQFRELEGKFALKNENNPTLFPFHYHNEMAYFQTVAIFLKKKFNLQIVQAVDYLEYESFIIISYFYKKADELINNLLVLDEQNQVLLHQNIGLQLTGISLDTFFVFREQLFFVKHKTHLESLKLK